MTRIENNLRCQATQGNSFDHVRQRDQPNVLLVHYDDLQSDLDGQMRMIADRLGFDAPEQSWARLVEAATFEQMRARAGELAPDPAGVLKDTAVFFRQGRSGAGREHLKPEDLIRYAERVARLVPADLISWLHRDPR